MALARKRAARNWLAIEEGADPRVPPAPTFREAADQVIALYSKEWTSDATEQQWRNTLERHVFPHIGHLRVDASGVTAREVLAVLAPVWSDKPTVARKLLHRLGTIFDWAVANQYRADNPAGPVVLKALPKQTAKTSPPRRARVGEGPGVRRSPQRQGRRYVAVGGAVRGVGHAHPLVGRRRLRALEWAEIDEDRRVWTIPAERVKTRQPMRVPLTEGMAKVLAAAAEQADSTGLVFPTQTGKRYQTAPLLSAVKDIDPTATTHGMRSCFRDWARDNGVSREIAEACLGHTVGGVEAAYARSDLLEARRPVMEAWSDYLAG